MAAARRVSGSVRQGDLDLRSVLRSRWRGRRDAAWLKPLLAGPSPDPSVSGLVSAYVQEVQAATAQATGLMRARLLRDRRGLVTRIQADATAIVTQYDVRDSPSPALLCRWGGAVAEWRTEATDCRNYANSLVGSGNLRLARYWDTVWLLARPSGRSSPRPELWLPGEIVLDDSWRYPDNWLFSTTEGPSALDRALRLLDEQPLQPTGPNR